MVTAMLFAGGIGARMKYSDMPKQFLEVGGKPIIIHTMEHFARHPKVDAIVVACKADWIGYLNELIEAFNVPKVKAVVPGGANGFDSIHNGVMATAEFSKDPEDIILICDGVRPMLSEELITNCIKDTKKYKTAVPVTPSIDSLLQTVRLTALTPVLKKLRTALLNRRSRTARLTKRVTKLTGTASVPPNSPSFSRLISTDFSMTALPTTKNLKQTSMKCSATIPIHRLPSILKITA